MGFDGPKTNPKTHQSMRLHQSKVTIGTIRHVNSQIKMIKIIQPKQQSTSRASSHWMVIVQYTPKENFAARQIGQENFCGWNGFVRISMAMNTKYHYLFFWSGGNFECSFCSKRMFPPASRRAASPLGVDGDAATMPLQTHRRLVMTNVFGGQRRDWSRWSLLLHFNQVIWEIETKIVTSNTRFPKSVNHIIRDRRTERQTDQQLNLPTETPSYKVIMNKKLKNNSPRL